LTSLRNVLSFGGANLLRLSLGRGFGMPVKLRRGASRPN
jgi:hypothetical protein